MDTLLIALLQWISANSSYITDNIPLPTVIEMTPKELTSEYYAEHTSKIPSDGVVEKLKALYDAENQILYVIQAKLMDKFSEFEDPKDNPVWRETLLHELIHHVQWQSGLREQWQCNHFGEKDAYLLGGKYLTQHFVEDPLPNRQYLAIIYSRC